MHLGSDKLLNLNAQKIRNSCVGLLAHQASINSEGKHILKVLLEENIMPKALFGPEHGFESLAQDMEGVSHHMLRAASKSNPGSRLRSNNSDIPIYSLYGKTVESLKPTREMFDGLEYLIIDLQDAGSRYYTYIYTTAFCMETARETGTKVIVCDRPNPINGIDVEGSLVEKNFRSFVGWYPLPNRHGMTIGELARMFNEEAGIGCNLEVIKMAGWKRKWYWDDCALEWVNPSPNMRSLNAAILYPGICLIEGTNISEGRGTETPFEICGAPFVNGGLLAQKLREYNLKGIEFKPATFTPERQKWSGEECEGIRLKITDRSKFRPYNTGLAVVEALSSFKEFKWRTEEYEFVKDKPAIDLLTGSDLFREEIVGTHQFDSLLKTPEKFLKKREDYLIY